MGLVGAGYRRYGVGAVGKGREERSEGLPANGNYLKRYHCVEMLFVAVQRRVKRDDGSTGVGNLSDSG